MEKTTKNELEEEFDVLAGGNFFFPMKTKVKTKGEKKRMGPSHTSGWCTGRCAWIT